MSQFSFEQKIEIVSKMALDYCNENGLKFKQYNQKFAELIVRECARVAAQTPCPYDDEDARKTFGHTWDVACIEAARDIKKHFGV